MTRSTPIAVANAPCSWGALEFDWAGDAPPYARVLDEMAAAGYAGTELGDWGFLPTDPLALRDELARRRLVLVGAFVPVPLTDARARSGGVDSAMRIARLLRAASTTSPFIVLADDTAAEASRARRAGRIQREDGLDEEGWRVLSEGAETIARRVADDTGLRTVFHHHCATFVETPWEIEALMARTHPDVLGLCLDTGHAVFGGADPLALLRTWGSRIWHVHLKDCHPDVVRRASEGNWDYAQAVREGVFCELGHGAVDFRAVTEALCASAYSGWVVVEQDVLPSMGTPLASAIRNRMYLEALGL